MLYLGYFTSVTGGSQWEKTLNNLGDGDDGGENDVDRGDGDGSDGDGDDKQGFNKSLPEAAQCRCGQMTRKLANVIQSDTWVRAG